MAEVTDPALIAKLEAAEKASSGTEVSDPALIAKLEAASKGDESESEPNAYSSFLPQVKRQAGLAARAVLEAPAQIAAMPGDAITSVVNAVKHPSRVLNPQEWNPFTAPKHLPGDMIPAGEQISEAYGKVFPTPETTLENVAYGVESVLAGSKVPMGKKPPAIPAEATAAGKGSLPNAKWVDKPANPTAIDQVRAGLQAQSARDKGAAKAEKKQTKDAVSALKKVEQALKRDKRNSAEASQEVTAAQKKGVPLTLADAGPNTTTTAEVAAQRPGEAQAIMHKDRLDTTKNEKARVGGATREALNAKEDAGLYQQGLEHVRSDKAKVNYEAVRQDATPVVDKDINKILDNPVVQNLYEKARASHMTERGLAETTGSKNNTPLVDIYATKTTKSPIVDKTGTPFQNLEASKVGTVPDVRSLDYLVRAMDKEITRMYAEARKGGTEGGVASELKVAMNAIKNRLEKISPAYKRASEQYGLDSQLMDAREYGEKEFLSQTPGVAAQYVNGLTDAGKKALRVGVARKLLKGLETTSRNVDVGSNVLGGDNQQKLLRTLFPNGKDFDVFKQMLETESKIHQNTGQITKGSQTFRRAAAAEDFEEVPMSEKLGKMAKIGNLISKGWVGTGLSSLLHLMNHPTWNQGKAEAVARILTSKNPENSIARIKLLEKQLPSAGKKWADRVTPKVGTLKGALTLKNNNPDSEVSSRLMSPQGKPVSPWVSAEGATYPSNLKDSPQ